MPVFCSDPLPLLATDAGLPKNFGEQCDTYIASVRMRNAHRDLVASHELVLSS